MKKKLLLLFCLMLALMFGVNIVSSTTSMNNVHAAKVKISKKKATMYVDDELKLKIKGTKKTVKWSSSNKKVASVNKKGKVFANKAGKATITGKVGKKKYKCKITVKEYDNDEEEEEEQVVVSNIVLNKNGIDLEIGQSEKLVATVYPASANVTVNWTSNNKAVATVSQDGTVTAISEGTTYVYAFTSGKNVYCVVNVKKPIVEVSGITLSKTSLELIEGGSETISATISPDDATDKSYTWSTSDSNVATVDNGKITAISKGVATITATSKNGKTASCEVTVKREFEIELPEFPATYRYIGSSTQTIYSSCTVTDIRYEKNNYQSVKVFISGKKYYDKQGDSHSSACQIGWKLYKGDAVVDSGTIYSPAVAVGESFADAYTYIFGLEKGTEYKLVFLNVSTN